MAKRKTGSMLLGALGKTKKEQMKVLYPGMSSGKKATKLTPKISKSKNVSSSAKGTKATSEQMLARRKILAGVRDTKRKPGFKTGVVAGGAGAVGIGKYKNKRKEEAKDAADKLLKKQREKKKSRDK
tara:strand:+ start:54 stop:434 length:381 start_codon:yes stop_codon:yes gene_type:complete